MARSRGRRNDDNTGTQEVPETPETGLWETTAASDQEVTESDVTNDDTQEITTNQEESETMTDTAQEVTEETTDATNEETTEETSETPAIPDFGHPLLNMAAAEVVTIITSINEKNAVLKAQNERFSKTKILDYAKSDGAPAEIKALFVTYEELTKKMDAAFEAINEAAKPHLGGSSLSDEQVTGMQEEVKELRNQAKAAVELIGSMGTTSNNAAAKEWAESVNIPGTRTTRSDKGTAGTLSRPKLKAITLPNGDVVTTFTKAAKALSDSGTKTRVPEIHEAWYAVAGTSDWKAIKTELTVTVNGAEITITPKDDAESE